LSERLVSLDGVLARLAIKSQSILAKVLVPRKAASSARLALLIAIWLAPATDTYVFV
jgi:hypothetical protein